MRQRRTGTAACGRTCKTVADVSRESERSRLTDADAALDIPVGDESKYFSTLAGGHNGADHTPPPDRPHTSGPAAHLHRDPDPHISTGPHSTPGPLPRCVRTAMTARGSHLAQEQFDDNACPNHPPEESQALGNHRHPSVAWRHSHTTLIRMSPSLGSRTDELDANHGSRCNRRRAPDPDTSPGRTKPPPGQTTPPPGRNLTPRPEGPHPHRAGTTHHHQKDHPTTGRSADSIAAVARGGLPALGGGCAG